MSGDIRIYRHAGFAWQCPFSRRELEAVLDAMRRVCGLDGVFLELILAGDGLISAINEDFLGCAGPTNILSFPPAPGTGTAPQNRATSGTNPLPPVRRQGFAEAPLRSLAQANRSGRGANGGASLVLSLDTFERECLLYGQDAAEHLLRLLAHGMAHVGGLDHGPAMDAAQDAAFAAGLRAF